VTNAVLDRNRRAHPNWLGSILLSSDTLISESARHADHHFASRNRDARINHHVAIHGVDCDSFVAFVHVAVTQPTFAPVARQAQYLGQIFDVARARDSIASCK
jgi:hypothetical protein